MSILKALKNFRGLSGSGCVEISGMVTLQALRSCFGPLLIHGFKTILGPSFITGGFNAWNSTQHELHETCHSVTFYFMKKDSKRCCDIRMPESIHTKDESKRGSAFAFIFGVN